MSVITFRRAALASAHTSNVISLCDARALRAARSEDAEQVNSILVSPGMPDELICYFGVHKLVSLVYVFSKSDPRLAQRVLSDFSDGELNAVERFIAAVDPTLASAFVSTVLAVQEMPPARRVKTQARRTGQRRSRSRSDASSEIGSSSD